MTGRFTTNGYKIYDTFHDGRHWLVNTVEAEEIVGVMNNLDSKARERSKALSKLQKENYRLRNTEMPKHLNMNEKEDLYNRKADIIFNLIIEIMRNQKNPLWKQYAKEYNAINKKLKEFGIHETNVNEEEIPEWIH